MLGSVVMGQVVSVTVFSLIGLGHVISGKGYQDLCEISLDSAARSDTPSSGDNPDHGQNTPNTVEFRISNIWHLSRDSLPVTWCLEFCHFNLLRSVFVGIFPWPNYEMLLLQG